MISLSLIIFLNTTNIFALYFTFATLLIYLIYHYIERFKLAFSPMKIFRLNFEKEKLEKSFNEGKIIDTFLNSANNQNTPEESKRLNDLGILILLETLFAFVISKLKILVDRKLYLGFFTIKIISTLLITSIILSLLNLILSFIDNNAFILTSNANYFDYYYYSFHSMFFNSIEYIKPLSVFAKILNILAPILGIIITLILFTLFLSAKDDVYKDNINKVIKYGENQLIIIETRISENYKIDILDALDELKQMKSAFYKIIDIFRRY
ncbi:MAG: hypothetical protein V1779_10655 [bacterium]